LIGGARGSRWVEGHDAPMVSRVRSEVGDERTNSNVGDAIADSLEGRRVGVVGGRAPLETDEGVVADWIDLCTECGGKEPGDELGLRIEGRPPGTTKVDSVAKAEPAQAESTACTLQ
jgi:hypothetical protein